MIWNEHHECMDREQLRELQGRRLKKTVERVYYNVPFYRAKMQALGLEPGDINTIDDLTKLPFTTKQDLRDNYPFGLFAVPQSEVVRIHASSGTTGKPTVVGFTRKDVETFSEIVARAIAMAGGSKDDVIQIGYGYGLFTGGLGLHYGAEKLGCSVIPISGGNTNKQLQLMEDFGTTILACTASYAVLLSETIKERGIVDKLKLRLGIFGAEPWTEEMRKTIETNLGIKAIDIYGLSEIMGPGVSCECEYQNGLHIAEDHFVPEILNADTLEPAPEGETGELVFTTITKEALPLLRYRTRDLTRLTYEKCECGRTTARMYKCTGRTDDMLIIRGVNVFPSQVESILLEMPETKPYYLLKVDRKGAMDTLEIQVEVEDRFFSDEIGKLQALSNKIKRKIEGVLGISVILTLCEPRTLQRTEGKSTRVIDNRKLK